MSEESSAATVRWQRWIGPALLGVSCLCFGAALSAPMFTVSPGAGDLTGWLRAMKPDLMASVSQSLLGGIVHLFQDGDFILAALLALFCVAFPVAKYLVLSGEIFGLEFAHNVWARIMQTAAPLAMVDVYVLALLVLIIKGLPGGSHMCLESGAWFFIASVLLSFGGSRLLKKSKKLFDT